MKSILTTVGALLICSCRSQPTFHDHVVHDPCPPIYFLVTEKMDEIVDALEVEFDRLQKTNTTSPEHRAYFLHVACVHFPESELHRLGPLLEKGLQDSNSDVRLKAFGLITGWLDDDGLDLLKRHTNHADLVIRKSIVKVLNDKKTKPEQALSPALRDR